MNEELRKFRIRNSEFSDKCHCEEGSDVAIQGKFRILRENAVVRSRQVMEQKFWGRIDYEGGSLHLGCTLLQFGESIDLYGMIFS